MYQFETVLIRQRDANRHRFLFLFRNCFVWEEWKETVWEEGVGGGI